MDWPKTIVEQKAALSSLNSLRSTVCVPRRLQQVVAHLLSNAAKFTPREGRIEVKTLQSSGGGITIKITDTGIGMEPSRIGHALDPFKQLDSRLARRFEGVGLGLPLANALM